MNGLITGVGSSYSVPVSGLGAPTAGTWLFAVVWDSTQEGNDIAITGGSAWTRTTGTGAGIPGITCFRKLCGNAEPLSYSVNYAGAVSTDSAACTIIEIVGASASNPNVVLEDSNTDTSPAVPFTTQGSVIALAIGMNGTVTTAPSGFTLWGNLSTGYYGGVPGGSVAIATYVMPADGSLTPGPWTLSSTAYDALWTFAFQC